MGFIQKIVTNKQKRQKEKEKYEKERDNPRHMTPDHNLPKMTNEANTKCVHSCETHTLSNN